MIPSKFWNNGFNEPPAVQWEYVMGIYIYNGYNGNLNPWDVTRQNTEHMELL